MAVEAQTIPFEGFVLKIADPAVLPLAYAYPCGITEESITWTNTPSEQAVPFCDDVSLPSAVKRSIVSTSVEISATGFLTSQAEPVWKAFRKSGKSWPCQIEEVHQGALGTQVTSGNFVLTSMGKSVTKGELVQVQISLSSDGPVATA